MRRAADDSDDSVAIPVLSARAESLEEMMKQSEKLQKEAKELDRIIKSQQKNLTDQKAYVKALEDKINNYAAQIDVLINRINKMEENINGVKAEIWKRKPKLRQRKTSFRKGFRCCVRLRSLSKPAAYHSADAAEHRQLCRLPDKIRDNEADPKMTRG